MKSITTTINRAPHQEAPSNMKLHKISRLIFVSNHSLYGSPAEEYLSLFEDTKFSAIDAKHVTIQPEDLALAHRL